MHNLTKIKIFRIALFITYPLALIFLYPIVLLKKKNEGRFFFFLDRYVIGGAQTVHLNILSTIPEFKKQLYFTRYSPDDKQKAEFYSTPNSTSRDIHFWCDNLLFRVFTVHFYAFYVNRHSDAIVFGSNSTFYYDMLYFFRKDITTIELLHAFSFGNTGMEFFGLANYKSLSYRLVIEPATRKNMENQYKEYNVPAEYMNRVVMIEPGVRLPEKKHKKEIGDTLNVLYAGRGTKEKRVYLVSKIAESLLRENTNISFHFAGTMESELSDYVKKNSTVYGEITQQEKLYDIYRKCHVTIITSTFEGFPMALKEGMANGCIPLATTVGGITVHLKDGYNGLLITQPENEQAVVDSAIKHIKTLAGDKELVMQLSNNALEYAYEHFNINRFKDKYREFLTSL